MIFRRFAWALIGLITGLLLAGYGAVAAQTPSPPVREVTDDEVNEIAKELYCPVCENIPLDVCPTQACVQWRDTIHDLLGQGYDRAEIEEYFVVRYGEQVLAAPRAEGVNLLFWLLPPLAVLIGGALLWGSLRNKPAPQPEPPTAPPPATAENDPDSAYRQRLEDELDKPRHD